MKFSELIGHSITCIKTFNPVVTTIDSHADEFIARFTDPYEKVFVKQVFYGCTRYQDFLKIFTRVFFERSSGINRNDAILYQIFAYMSFFRLEELAQEDFRKLIVSQEATKMHAFLQFTFNVEMLREHLREPWMQIYDFQYIDEKIIGGIERNFPSVADLMQVVERRATGKVQSTLSRRAGSASMSERTGSRMSTSGQTAASDAFNQPGEEEQKQPKRTEFVPFNLTKQKPKLIPPPEQIKKEIKARPLPKNMNKKSLADIEKEKKQRRQATANAIRGDYIGNTQQRFQLATEARPSSARFQKVKQEVEQKMTQELKPKGLNKARPMPNFDKKTANVKLNAAALKREKHLIDQEEREFKEQIDKMTMGLKDASEFNRWKSEMTEKDEIERLEQIAKKKIEMEMARELAIQARENQERENHALVNDMRQNMDAMMEEREINLQEIIEQKKEVIAQVQQTKEAAAEQVIIKKQENKAIRDEVHRDLQEGLKQRQDEEAAQLAQKAELIRQIRELEKIPIQRTKGFDPTEAGGHGLMEEMSIAELRERLEHNKREQEQAINFKRETNLTRKEEEAQRLMEEAKQVEEARNRRKAQNEARRQKKQTDAASHAAKTQAAREKGLLEVHGKIETKKRDKREEDARLAQELKEIKLQRQYLNANAAMVEEQAWKQLEAGKERQIRNYQNDRLIEQCGVNQIYVKDQGVRADNAKQSVLNKLEYDQGYTGRLETRRRENEVLHKNNLEYKAAQHEKQQAAESNLREAEKKRQPFVAKVNEQSIAKATVYKQKQAQRQRMANMTAESLEFAALQGEEDFGEMPEGQDDFGGMDSALDMLGEAEQAADDIEAKFALE